VFHKISTAKNGGRIRRTRDLSAIQGILLLKHLRKTVHASVLNNA